MKACPVCRRTFDDSLSFCLEDGALLSAPIEKAPDPHRTLRLIPPIENIPQTDPVIEPAETETVVRPAVSPSRSRRGIILAAGGIAGLIAIVLAAGVYKIFLSGSAYTGAGPEEVVWALNRAIQKRDAATFIELYDPEYIDALEVEAKAGGMPPKQIIKKDLDAGYYDTKLIEQFGFAEVDDDRFAIAHVVQKGEWTTIKLKKIKGVWRYSS